MSRDPLHHPSPCTSELITVSSPQEVLAYSNSSARGRAFLNHLTDLSVRNTLFVPHNSGLGENEVRRGPAVCASDSCFDRIPYLSPQVTQNSVAAQVLSSHTSGQRAAVALAGLAHGPVMAWPPAGGGSRPPAHRPRHVRTALAAGGH